MSEKRGDEGERWVSGNDIVIWVVRCESGGGLGRLAGVADDDDDVGRKSTNTNESKEATKCLRITPLETFWPEENNKIVTGCVIMF